MILLLVAAALFHYVGASSEFMREKPGTESEVVSQLYHSEEVKILEKSDDWIKVENKVDSYQGWIKSNSIYSTEKPFFTPSPSEQIAQVSRLAVHVFHTNDTIYGPITTLPYESKLIVIDQTDARWLKIKTTWAKSEESFI